MDQLVELIKEYWKYVFGILGLIIVGTFLFLNPPRGEAHEPLSKMIDEETLSETESVEEKDHESDEPTGDESAWIMVDIKGHVKYPGVYEVLDHSRVKDVVELAGGFTEEANSLTVNLAEKVMDQMVIYVGGADDASIIQASAEQESKDSNLKVNINQANKEELMQLNSIGGVKAESIIQYREENGLFERIEDLMNVSGIGEKTFENLKDNLTV